MMKIWFFEVVMAIEMCKILELKGERPGKPSVLGGCCLRAGRFVCVLSPTSHCLFANSLKNWTRSLIGAWRGSSCSGICIYAPKAPPPPLVALAYFLMVWNKSPQVLSINFIHLDARACSKMAATFLFSFCAEGVCKFRVLRTQITWFTELNLEILDPLNTVGHLQATYQT